jgi:hypothetical protein
MSWDFGFLRFNESSIGLLRERAEINSFANFEAWMNRMAGGDPQLARQLEEIFLTKDVFSELERDIVSLFLSEYEAFLIDPGHPFHDIYADFLASRTFAQLDDADREELVVGALLRLTANIESEYPQDVFKQLLSFARSPQKSPTFRRFIEIIDYVFCEGGLIKPSFLDIKTPLRFIHQKTTWDDEKEKRVAMYTISEMVKGMSVPVKETPKIKLRSLSERLKDRIKK